jgi:hypothetical protein
LLKNPAKRLKIMNSETTPKVESDQTEMPRSPTEQSEETIESTEFPFYIVPPPPIPGKTAWSIA